MSLMGRHVGSGLGQGAQQPHGLDDGRRRPAHGAVEQQHRNDRKPAGMPHASTVADAATETTASAAHLHHAGVDCATCPGEEDEDEAGARPRPGTGLRHESDPPAH